MFRNPRKNLDLESNQYNFQKFDCQKNYEIFKKNWRSSRKLFKTDFQESLCLSEIF